MHLGNADRQVGREITAQSAQGVVPQSRGDCHRGRRLRHFRVEAPAARIFVPFVWRYVAGLPLPRAGGANAATPDRHGSLQIRRVQAIPNRSTQTLAFVAGKFDMTFPYEMTVQTMRDIKAQAPSAICELTPTIVAINLLLNRDAPPFDNPDIRRAMQLTLDRKSFLDILSEGQGDISGAMLPPPGGLWGLLPEILATLPGYGPDVAANRAEARRLMEKHGYGPNNRLAVKVATRNIPQFRDPAVIMIDQMKEIYVDGELDVVETANWYPKVARKGYMVGTNLSGSGVDDPDAYFYEHYACGSERNYTNYCNPELEKMYERQSIEADQEKRKKLVWEIDRRLQEEAARPMVYHYRLGTCWYPRVHGITVMVNSIFNGWRFEEAWLDK